MGRGGGGLIKNNKVDIKQYGFVLWQISKKPVERLLSNLYFFLFRILFQVLKMYCFHFLKVKETFVNALVFFILKSKAVTFNSVLIPPNENQKQK